MAAGTADHERIFVAQGKVSIQNCVRHSPEYVLLSYHCGHNVLFLEMANSCVTLASFDFTKCKAKIVSDS